MIKYINRNGKEYYLHKKKSKFGGFSYNFSFDNKAYESSIPDGYEIYEHPNAQVFLRKIKPKIITDLEVQVVKKEVKRSTNLKYVILDIKKNCLSVYTGDSHAEELRESFDSFSLLFGKSMPIEKHLNYSEVMRFTLVEKKERLFQTERYCYRGSVDDWIPIGTLGKIKELARRYIKHIGKDSYYELAF